MYPANHSDISSHTLPRSVVLTTSAQGLTITKNQLKFVIREKLRNYRCNSGASQFVHQNHITRPEVPSVQTLA